MGGKPQKPKIQAYVEQRWFDEFEVYRASHDLNQSKALQKILAEFFGGASASTLPPGGLDTVATSALVDSLRSELTELRYELDHRLQLVESRLAIESAHKSAVGITKSASESAILIDESASESAIGQDESAVDLDGLATELATNQAESARLWDESASESADESAMGQAESASESAIIEDVAIAALQASSPLVAQGELPDNTPESQALQGEPLVDSEPLENIAIAVNSLEDMAFGGTGEVGSADAGNTLEVTPVLATSSSEPADEAAPAPYCQRQNLEPLTSTGLAERLGVNESNISRNKGKGNEHFRRWSRKRDPNGIAWEYRLTAKLKYHPVI